jgi:hypothetical protein
MNTDAYRLPSTPSEIEAFLAKFDRQVALGTVEFTRYFADDVDDESLKGPQPMTDFSTVQAGTIPAGTVTPLGTVEATSYTAYKIDGEWVPFHRIHGKPSPATPLVTFG